MEFLTELWLPILLSGVFVFIVSSVIHMALPWHKGDWGKMDGEAEALAVMREHGVKPGQYMFPCPASMKDASSDEMQAGYKEGPVGFMTVIPNGMPSMGKNLALWFLYSILISVFAGYLAWVAHGATDNYLTVFRFTGTVAVLAYGVSYIPDSLWKGLPWSITSKFIIDGVVYGLVTAGTFAWLWPHL